LHIQTAHGAAEKPTMSAIDQPQQTRFRLTRSFALVAGLVMVVAAVLLSALHWYWSQDELESMAQQNNVNVARVLANLLWSRDAALLEDLAKADPDTLKTRPDVATLRGEIAALTQNAPVYRVKIYDLDGHTIFSTDDEQIGEEEEEDEGFESALHGTVASELARANTFSVFESTMVDRDLLSSYVPIYRGNEIVGVFEVYDDVTEFLRDINRGIAWQVALVVLTAGAVYLVLSAYVRHGDRLLQQEHERSLALVQSVARAEAASKAKSQFLSNMSHELRTPLNSVIGFAEILISEGFGPLGDKRYHEYAREIVDGGRSLLTIIEDTLDLSRIELGTAEISRRPVDAVALIEGVTRSLEPLITQSGIALSVEIDPKTPMVESDEPKLRKILVNLLSNAVKFTPAQGKVHIRVSGNPAGGLRFEIADTGIGLSSGDVAVALAPFGQVDGALNRRYQGAGLGLPLAKGLAELLGGKLEIDGERGRGTTVAVTLPA
jgi:signal transduction histidine kinase